MDRINYEILMGKRKKRKWCFIMRPSSYELSCDICGGSDLEWSEYEYLVWCNTCEKDTIGQGGLFDGPISVDLCLELGFSFDKIDLETGQRLVMKQTKDGVTWEAESCEEG